MTTTAEQLSATTLLRFATAGSVDDGKSTLVGRLLHDSKSVLTDQLEAVEQASLNRGQEAPDLALLTDGLRAEREQGITIDVAYRYFATARRRFILADTPGHVQYTRNMVTGASTAELAVVLVDARNGVVEQTRRHAAVAALLRVPHVVLAVNKMDLVDYAEPVFAAIAEEFTAYAASLGVPEITAIPISALAGDNVVEPSAHMDWYGGPTVLEHLETVPVSHDLTACHARFPVQYVIRPQSAEHPDYRGYAGQIAAGVFRVGEAVAVLPSGRTTTITGIDALGESVDIAWAPQSVTLRLADDIDISRGDLIAPADDSPAVTQDVEATVCHVADQPLSVGQRVLLKHTTRTVKAIVKDIPSRLTLDDLSQHPAPGQLVANDIGRVVVRTAEPLALDSYEDSRRTGSFLLIDPADGTTLSAGMAGAAFAAAAEAVAAVDDAEWDF
ncbi:MULTISPECIES: sulfate adenylyltransferase subunit 1 [Streptomyces]|uniref:sulfate adenylyltransferase n=1 Tax=Streptomyces griseus subsp. griseus (strain JCM 4626 / CBS 651.72 / NBRC 13350 / KCC S-0626 / ISP 5235) TaxID=455632 RepID=B1VW99_STRGG|nr:GTP-binding protein [Streptomyces griseus]MBW3703871.1 sulfate adenylyltransferase [Streptomyces griseus]BAG18225.1 putative sulfate adenylyltransferase subunit 1 [Streptomyces griseus subsp. griseus NBRC 13350]SED54659.1 sulfate adenylyltransferase subunit 1 [Streptomyces griseus]SQA22399.1 Sulfate adenylyltransferase large subunit [Streptomyces griseus]